MSTSVFASMPKHERLERWATLLERHQGSLRALQDIEFVPRAQRASLRAPDSALAVAYADPVLRRAGLDSDQFAETYRFFKMSGWSAHYILCQCHYGTARIAPDVVAKRVRAAARRARMFDWAWPKLNPAWLPAPAAAALLVAVLVL